MRAISCIFLCLIKFEGRDDPHPGLDAIDTRALTIDTLSARMRKDEYLQAETKKVHAEIDKLEAEKQMLVEKVGLIHLQKEYVHLKILKMRAEMEDRKLKSEFIDRSTCSFYS